MSTAQERLREHLADIEELKNQLHSAEVGACDDAMKVMGEFIDKLRDFTGADGIDRSTYDMAMEVRNFELIIRFDGSEGPLDNQPIDALTNPEKEFGEADVIAKLTKDWKPVFTEEEIELVYAAAELLHDKQEENTW